MGFILISSLHSAVFASTELGNSKEVAESACIRNLVGSVRSTESEIELQTTIAKIRGICGGQSTAQVYDEIQEASSALLSAKAFIRGRWELILARAADAKSQEIAEERMNSGKRTVAHKRKELAAEIRKLHGANLIDSAIQDFINDDSSPPVPRINTQRLN